MEDWLRVTNIETPCRIGVTAEERSSPQTLLIDVELPVDAARAAETDHVGSSVDYAALVGQVRVFAAEHTFQLMETLADRLARTLIEIAGSSTVRVRVRKRALAGIGCAEVEVERRRLQA